MYLEKLISRRGSKKKAVIMEALAFKALIDALKKSDGSLQGLSKAYNHLKQEYAPLQQALNQIQGAKSLNDAIAVIRSLTAWVQQVYQQIQRESDGGNQLAPQQIVQPGEHQEQNVQTTNEIEPPPMPPKRTNVLFE